MMVVDYPNVEVSCEQQTTELKEKLITLEKTNDELNHKLNQRDAELKICYVNIALLVIVIFLIIAFKIVKNIRKGK